jgi:hypothetical protein
MAAPLKFRHVFRLAVLCGIIIFSCTDERAPLEPLPQADRGVVSGTVAAQGKGVPDATVRLESVVDGLPLSISEQLGANRDSDEIVAPVSPRVALTNEQGMFAFSGVEPGSYLITTSAANHLGGRAAFTVTPAQAAAETTIVDIDLVPTGTFTGNVTLQNETDHSGSIVYVLGSSYVAVTDIAGDYALTGVPVGAHDVEAAHAGWIDQGTSGNIAFAGDSTALASLVLPRENNVAPIASIDSLPAFPVQNSLNAISFVSSSTDPDGTIVLYEWDYEDDGVFDATFTGAQNHDIAITVAAGTRRTKLRVTDDKGAIGLDVVTYTVYAPFYVSSVTGSDANSGGAADPFAKIQTGINAAAAQGRPVLVDNLASYSEAPVFSSYVDVRGGYDGAWNPTSTKSLVLMDSYSSARAASVSNAEIRGFRFERDHAQGDAATAIGMKLIACSSSLRFVDCEIVVGNGTAALLTSAAGNPGVNGSSGGSGGEGCDGAVPSGCELAFGGCLGAYGGAPGNGSASGFSGGQSCYAPQFGTGHTGYPGQGPAGGLGGAGPDDNICGSPGDGQSGGQGADGLNGANGGAVAASFGSIAGETWFGPAGLLGSAGTAGAGGSGGGGGGSAGDPCKHVGGGGGGGGGSGGPGTGGEGGFHGGASIAVLVIGGSPTFESCFIQSGNGGNGWRGGAGGAGGQGGPLGLGGSGYSTAGDGGNGGTGGDGGDGGGGSGGPGGPSVGVYQYQIAAMTLVDITWSIGNGGTGGPGGLHGNGGTQAVAGPDGPTAQTYVNP